MALLNELCIHRYFEIAQDPEAWKVLTEYISLPELDEQEFFQQCIDQTCLLTLHLSSLAKLKEAGTDLDEQVQVGLEVSRWIMSTQVKDPEISIKLVLLLGTFIKVMKSFSFSLCFSILQDDLQVEDRG